MKKFNPPYLFIYSLPIFLFSFQLSASMDILNHEEEFTYYAETNGDYPGQKTRALLIDNDTDIKIVSDLASIYKNIQKITSFPFKISTTISNEKIWSILKNNQGQILFIIRDQEAQDEDTVEDEDTDTTAQNGDEKDEDGEEDDNTSTRKPAPEFTERLEELEDLARQSGGLEKLLEELGINNSGQIIDILFHPH
ncbi:MAG: hypothetical protein OXB84_02635 [Halobacteriovoraceae bacterium]|nr:hypothetical protein [Halobacteriovoraceae bacterium]